MSPISGIRNQKIFQPTRKLVLQEVFLLPFHWGVCTGSVLSYPYEMERTLNYLEIPVLFAVRPANFVSIVVGPQVSFLLSQKDKLSFGENSIQNEEEFKNDNWRKNMLGLHVGLDFNIKHFVISPRASIDFQDNKGDGSSTDPRYKNFLVQLTLGYRF
jgi:hypothetical protein